MPALRQILVWVFPVVFGGSTLRETYGSGKGKRYNVPRSKSSPEEVNTDSMMPLNRSGTATTWDTAASTGPTLKQWSSHKDSGWIVSMEDVKLKKLNHSAVYEDEELIHEQRRMSRSGILITETRLGPA